MLVYENLEYASWQELKEQLSNFPHDWIFRGQGKSSWDLVSSIDRALFSTGLKNIEKFFIEEFKRGSSNYLSGEKEPSTLAEWL